MTKNREDNHIYVEMLIIKGDFMNLFLWLSIIFISFIIFKSLVEFIQGGKVKIGIEMKERRFSTEIFYTLLIIYTIVIIGFGLIYFILSFQGVVLVKTNELEHLGVLGTLMESIYFSGVTLLTIGYGDISPIGIGRFIALIEALIGYILPTAFVLRLVIR